MRKIAEMNRSIWDEGGEIVVGERNSGDGRVLVDLRMNCSGDVLQMNRQEFSSHHACTSTTPITILGFHLSAEDAESLAALLLSCPSVRAIHDHRTAAKKAQKVDGRLQACYRGSVK